MATTDEGPRQRHLCAGARTPGRARVLSVRQAPAARLRRHLPPLRTSQTLVRNDSTPVAHFAGDGVEVVLVAPSTAGRAGADVVLGRVLDQVARVVVVLGVRLELGLVQSPSTVELVQTAGWVVEV